MTRSVKHILLPAIAPLMIVLLSLTPVTLFGCLNRGLMAVAVALVSAGFAFHAVFCAFAFQKKKDAVANWWILRAVILTIPLALPLGPLG